MVVLTTASLGSRAEEGGQGTSEKPPGERRLQDHVHFKKRGGGGLGEMKVSLGLPTFCEWLSIQVHGRGCGMAPAS